MNATVWILATAYAIVMTVLIRAGAAKLAFPTVTTTAISELWPRRPVPSPGWTRVLGVVEIVTAVLAATPAGRRPALGLILALGVGFAGVGVLGLIRGAREPCGCFGAGSDRPLGMANVAIGCLLLGFAMLALVIRVPNDDGGFAAATALLTVAGSAGWLLVIARRQIHNLLRVVSSGQELTA